MTATLDNLMLKLSTLAVRIAYRLPMRDAGFNEQDHPREDDGKFGSGGTGGTGGTGGKKHPDKEIMHGLHGPFATKEHATEYALERGHSKNSVRSRRGGFTVEHD